MRLMQQEAFEHYIRSGKGFIGIHSEADTEYDSDTNRINLNVHGLAARTYFYVVEPKEQTLHDSFVVVK